ncbi:MAG: DNA recombination protein RmuC [Porticoccaceae bacterium]
MNGLINSIANYTIDQRSLPMLMLTLALGIVIGVIVSALIIQSRRSRERALVDQERAHLLDNTTRLQDELTLDRERNQILSSENAGLLARLEADKQRYQEQIGLLQQTRESLGKEFENLANRIFEEKQATFTRHSRQTMETTVDPLRRELSAFKQKVEDVYEKENAERNKLVGQIGELQKQAQRIGDDAVQLAKALKGDSKVQGNWGEIVLERLLEESGLSKGREYDTQVSLRDESGRRRNPDVVLHLPDQRDIVIDAKVSLTEYERYCRCDDDSQRQQHLALHISSLRTHITDLNRKAYEQLVGINTLDFVFIFVPIEAAFMLAIEHDQTLFSYAYDRGIILVSPTTLLATLRTVHNIWRYEAQNRNAEKIAAQAGGVYDQLVLVVESLEATGYQLNKAQEAWGATRKRLVAGRGNLIKRIDDLKTMGAKTRDKKIPPALIEEAELEHESGEIDSALNLPGSADKATKLIPKDSAAKGSASKKSALQSSTPKKSAPQSPAPKKSVPKGPEHKDSLFGE